MADKQMSLHDAVAAHVRAGDVLHPVVGHTRWSAATREVVRQFWDTDPGFTLVMLSLSSLGALFFRGRLVRNVVTGYSGDTFPNFTPNPWFARAYEQRRMKCDVAVTLAPDVALLHAPVADRDGNVALHPPLL